MNKTVAAIPLLFAFAPAFAAVDGMATLFGGVKLLDKDEWEPTETNTAVGAAGVVTPEGKPFGVFASISHSWDEVTTDELTPGVNLDYEMSTTDALVGPVFYKRAEKVAGYAGGGLAYTNAEFTLSGPGGSVDGSGNGFGFWVGGGAQILFKDGFGVGIHAIFSRVDADIDGEDAKVGGILLAAAVGYHF